MARQHFATGLEGEAHTLHWPLADFMRLELHTIKDQDDLKAIAWSCRGWWPSAIDRITVEFRAEDQEVVMCVYIKEGRERTCVDMRKAR